MVLERGVGGDGLRDVELVLAAPRDDAEAGEPPQGRDVDEVPAPGDIPPQVTAVGSPVGDLVLDVAARDGDRDVAEEHARPREVGRVALRVDEVVGGLGRGVRSRGDVVGQEAVLVRRPGPEARRCAGVGQSPPHGVLHDAEVPLGRGVRVRLVGDRVQAVDRELARDAALAVDVGAAELLAVVSLPVRDLAALETVLVPLDVLLQGGRDLAVGLAEGEEDRLLPGEGVDEVHHDREAVRPGARQRDAAVGGDLVAKVLRRRKPARGARGMCTSWSVAWSVGSRRVAVAARAGGEPAALALVGLLQRPRARSGDADVAQREGGGADVAERCMHS